MGLTTEVRGSGGVWELAVVGKVSASGVEELSGVLLPAVEAGGHGAIVLDCRGVEYVSSAGLQVFMRAIQARKRRGGDRLECVVKPGSMFAKMLVSTGLSDHMTLRHG